METVNIASQISAMADKMPYKRAVVFPAGRDRAGRVAYTHLTFAQLDRLSGEYARGLTAVGIGRGCKTLLMVKPSLDFFALVFALFKAGAVPVMIDPGMGIDRMLHCIRASGPEAFIGIPAAHAMRVFRPAFFRSVKHYVTVGRRWFWGGATLRRLARRGAGDPLSAARTGEDELAAVLFTTGSTGPAKGVEYTHGMFARQCRMIAEIYGVGADDIDLPAFPLFSLFSVGLGMTAVIPDMDATRPAAVDPRKIIEAVHNQGCTFSFGSPALWAKVSQYCADHGVKLPTLRKVLMAGAPVAARTHDNLLNKILPPGAETHTPYGATESLPVADMPGAEVLAETAGLTAQGKGTCVGRVVAGVELKIIRYIDAPIADISQIEELPQGQVGEIIVRGANVTRAYHRLPEATARQKIKDGDTVWHRIGDLAYLDEKGRIWFCGRAAHRVVTAAGEMYSVCCEAVFNQVPGVRRSALVGLGQPPAQTPAIIIERETPENGRDVAEAELRPRLLTAAAANPLTQNIREFLFHPGFPVDIRHNAKINREQLAEWAAAQVGLPRG